MDQKEMNIDVKKVSQLKVHINASEQINSLMNFAIDVISKGQRHCKYRNKILDVVSCFNLFLL